MRLMELRQERALSQRALAALSGVAKDTIGQIERGKRRAYPTTARKLATALGVEPVELMHRGGHNLSADRMARESRADKMAQDMGAENQRRKAQHD